MIYYYSLCYSLFNIRFLIISYMSNELLTYNDWIFKNFCLIIGMLFFLSVFLIILLRSILRNEIDSSCVSGGFDSAFDSSFDSLTIYSFSLSMLPSSSSSSSSFSMLPLSSCMLLSKLLLNMLSSSLSAVFCMDVYYWSWPNWIFQWEIYCLSRRQ